MIRLKATNRNSKLAVLCVAAVLGLTGAQLCAAAERSPFSLGVEGGTTGFGPVLQYTPSERYNFALSYGYYDFDGENMKTKRARYDADLTASNFAATVDWSPWSGHLHLTAGAVVYNHRFTVTARARKGNVYEIGDHDYTNTEITSVTGRVDTGTQVAPYIGVGWTWWFGDSGFGLHTNFGVMFTSNYDARLSATGPMSNDAVFLRDLRLEEDEMNDGFDVYPVAKVGFAYRF
ncbi:MAG TPA: hypothetical protein VK163_09820 [Opitutaceae bacterium]|nr:hypothetical protein [Opitutaceae bacterium]